ncbi:MAG: Rne/Rng family ribonuclease [Myxococcota bacterium]|jgi:ribonuclease E|nr:Rne/Rng family ribonuclease [Myxococcota bacterium]
MARKMIINAADSHEVRVAIVDTGKLEDFDIETRGVEKNKGNIYKGIVKAIEPALDAAFVDYGVDKQGFLTADEISSAVAGKPNRPGTGIAELLKKGQEILVQIEADEVNKKGAVLTTRLSLAGRYLVLMPDRERIGVSRRINSEDDRKKMRELTEKLEVPENMGVIMRTAGLDRTKTDLSRDMKVLLRLWQNIQKAAAKTKAPALIFKEQDLVIRALRDYFIKGIDEIIVDSDEAYDRAADYMQMVMPKQKSILTRYVERRPIYHHYKIEPQIESLYEKKVLLPAGGSLVIEQTEALVSIDVNSGKQKMDSQQKTALQTNLEAAAEFARQIRLRDLGGIIVVDFIDMAHRRYDRQIERCIRDAVKIDKARIKVGRLSPNGTLELTRQRIHSAMAKNITNPCSHCASTGKILKPEVHAMSVLRRVADRAAKADLLRARVRLASNAANYLQTERWSDVQAMEAFYQFKVEIVPDSSFLPVQVEFDFEADPKATPLEFPEPDFGPAPLPEGMTLEDLEDDEPEEEKLDLTAKPAANSDKGAEFDLPGFELISPEAFKRSARGGNRNRRPQRGRKRNDGNRSNESFDKKAKDAGDGRPNQRRRRRKPAQDKQGQNNRGRQKKQETQQAKPAAAEPAKKASFWKRILGISK